MENETVHIICHSCKQRTEIKGTINTQHEEETIDKCSKWLNSCDLNDATSVEDISEVSSITNTEDSIISKNDDIVLSDVVFAENENVGTFLNRSPSNFENIQVYKSKKVHIGDVTHINGPVIINQYQPTVNQQISINCNQSTNPTNFYVPIVARRTWLAQPPVSSSDIQPFQRPAKYVLIFHTASEEGYTQTDNNLNVRLIQQFHIESRKWNDISYNFLVGAEGSVYEGRGWDTVSSSATGYNKFSICISFIGYYKYKLPPDAALRNAKTLINYGVELGKIAKDYKLLAHCQCSSTESPGRKLFEDIKTWPNWDGSVSLEHPSPLIS